MKKIFLLCLFVLITLASAPLPIQAQCAMCTANAEQATKNGNTQGKGLNNGILYLLAIPYLLIAGVGTLWYLKYRKKPVAYSSNTSL